MAREAIGRVLEKHKAQAVRAEEGGREIFTVGAGANQVAYGFKGGALFVSTGRGSLLRLMDVSDKKGPSLADSPTFKEALGRVPVGEASNAVMLYTDLRQSLTGWDTDLAETPPSETEKATVNGLQYVVLGASGEQSGGFVKLDKASTSKVIQALLKVEGVPNGSAQFVPVSWGSYNSLNFPYLYALVLELLRLSPQTSQLPDQLPGNFEQSTGVKLADVFAALDGELAVGSNALEVLQEHARGQAKKDPKEEDHYTCISNTRNLGTALEMYSTDWSGLYPPSLAQLTPNYLKIIPNCPAAGKDTYSASYQVTTAPDAFTVFCQGTNHVQANYPEYSSVQGVIDPDYQRLRESHTDDDRMPEPTYILLIGLKSVEQYQKIADTLTARSGMQPGQAEKIGDTTVYQLHPQVQWAVVARPSPMLLIGVGPKPHDVLAKALGSEPKVAAAPAYTQMLPRAGKSWVTLGYQDFDGLMQALGEEMSQSSGDEAELGKVLMDLAKSSGDMNEASFLSVEADGLRLGGGGVSGSIMMAGVVGAAVLVPNFVRARGQGQLTACESNLKNIGTASEMYASDYEGRYPRSLSVLTPNYLRIIPNCPAANADTYSASYTMTVSPDAFTVFCQGHNHESVGTPADYPKYSAIQGLIDR